ncbi:hypothetical protein QCN27_07560 [Cereibacter sp. SYSU M97828]|nr:hypothetical protein [Cereibacter flavus]
MTAIIFKLTPQDHVAHDPAPIARIFREMDADSAEKVVNRALGELALSVAALSKQVVAFELSEVPRQLRRVARMADHLGMTTLAHTARDADYCLEHADATAFGAVWARMLRIAGSQIAAGETQRGRRV